jgi:hypothetical protein
MIIINMLIGLIIIAIIVSTLYVIGQIAERVLALSNLDFAESIFFGFICIMGIGLGAMLAYTIGAEVTH